MQHSEGLRENVAALLKAVVDTNKFEKEMTVRFGGKKAEVLEGTLSMGSDACIACPIGRCDAFQRTAVESFYVASFICYPIVLLLDSFPTLNGEWKWPFGQ